jgi:RNA polymerase sigma factor (TIGR02999 family)
VVVDRNPDLTGLLQAWSKGDDAAREHVAVAVQQELREIARRLLAGERRAGCQPTELVQESYLRLLDWRSVHWQNRAHFFSTVAGMMRRVLVDAARARQAAKRNFGQAAVSLDGVDVAASNSEVDIVAVSDAIDRLTAISARAGRVVEMRFFGGFSVTETADALGVSVRTVINDWNAARAWLYRTLSTPATVRAKDHDER